MVLWINRLFLAATAFSCLADVGCAFPSPSTLDDDLLFDSRHVFEDFGIARIKRADKVPLRILPLGASIMSGVGSSNGNG